MVLFDATYYFNFIKVVENYIQINIMAAEQSVESVPLPGEMFLHNFLEYLIFGIDIVVGIIIAVSIIRGVIMFFKVIRKPPQEQEKHEISIRRYIGVGLILALDIEVASDIIKSILNPASNELLALAVVVAIRIALGWSLSKDIKEEPSDNK